MPPYDGARELIFSPSFLLWLYQLPSFAVSS